MVGPWGETGVLSRGLRWRIIGLVMIGTVVNYLSRGTLAVAAPSFMAELDIGAREYSWVAAAFQFGLMLQPLAGYILDVAGLRTGLALFAAGWGLLTMAHGFVANWQGMAMLRAALGFAEGTSHPAGLKVVSEWFPAKERGFAAATYNLGASAGAALAAPLVAGAILIWDWRAAFVVAGLIALGWAIVWLVAYETPERHKGLSAGELAFIEAGQEPHIRATGGRPSFGKLLGQRNFWGLALPRFLADPTWGTLTFWMPIYLATVRGFDISEIALFAFLPFVAAEAGCLFGPAMVHMLERRGVGLVDARRWTFTFGALLMTGMMFVGLVEDARAAVALLCLGGFAHQTLSVTCITLASDLYPRNEVGTVAGLAGSIGNLGVAIFSLLIGAFVLTVGYAPFFVALGLLDLVAAALLWALIRRPATTPGDAIAG